LSASDFLSTPEFHHAVYMFPEPGRSPRQAASSDVHDRSAMSKINGPMLRCAPFMPVPTHRQTLRFGFSSEASTAHFKSRLSGVRRSLALAGHRTTGPGLFVAALPPSESARSISIAHVNEINIADGAEADSDLIVMHHHLKY